MNRGLRSANGCSQCRLGRVKCDERHPKCGRCNKRNTSCAYVKTLKWCTTQTTPRLTKRRKSDVPRGADQRNRPSRSVASGDDHTNVSDPQDWCPTEPIEPTLPVSLSNDLFEQSLDWDPNELSESYPSLYLSNLDQDDNVVSDLTWTLEPYGSDFEIGLGMIDQGALLMEVYFDRVAPIFCCYDGGKNPFYHLIAQAWRSDRRSSDYAPLISATQGLAAVFLMQDSISMRSLAEDLLERTQQQLCRISSVERYDVKHILALSFLGISRMYSQDLTSSLSVLNQLRDILQSETVAPSHGSRDAALRQRDRRFSWGLQLHCEMVFACTDARYRLPSLEAFQSMEWENATSNICPHPFTGVSSEITHRFLQAVLLVKRHRDLSRNQNFCSQKHIAKIQALMFDAAALEAKVTSDCLPDRSCIKSPEDRTTPVEHLIKLAECYRHSTLLLIYRVFPDVLAKRLGHGEADMDTSDTARAVNSHLLSMVLGIIGQLSTIPTESSTTPFQWIILLAASSELRLRNDYVSRLSEMEPSGTQHSISATDPQVLNTALQRGRKEDVIKSREFVIARTEASQKRIPGGRLPRLLHLMKKAWSLLDSGQTGTHWLDLIAD
ncbi:hypothetical protein BDZ85DRAFT_95351 [Elsinoe ampelina]|uniref:Zn(2)-C6 fungal-type domain-containing protein n=1 Tax=Elsinoe ampelina TaxID=302913 RepID=A0A6A6GE93_9PEZI|nr:hypothetical protein BDZ85DRAFT_95351 [Elsinoe ampelina]